MVFGLTEHLSTTDSKPLNCIVSLSFLNPWKALELFLETNPTVAFFVLLCLSNLSLLKSGSPSQEQSLKIQFTVESHLTSGLVCFRQVPNVLFSYSECFPRAPAFHLIAFSGAFCFTALFWIFLEQRSFSRGECLRSEESQADPEESLWQKSSFLVLQTFLGRYLVLAGAVVKHEGLMSRTQVTR